MKKQILSIAAVMMCGISLFGLTACGKPKSKTFNTSFGYSIKLTDEFKEQAGQGKFQFVAASSSVVVMVNKENFTTLNALPDVSDASTMTEEDYLTLVYNTYKENGTITQNSSTAPTLDEKTGLYYFTYTSSNTFGGYDYYAVANKGADAFYFTQFAEESQSQLRPQRFLKYALTITVE